MKKLILLLFPFAAISSYGQDKVTADVINAKKTFIVNKVVISAIQKDTSFTDSTKIPTSLAVRKFVEGRIALVGGGSTDTVSLSNRINLKQDKITLQKTATTDSATFSGSELNIPRGDGYLSAVLQVTDRFIDSSQNYLYANALRKFVKTTVADGIYDNLILVNPFSGDSSCSTCAKWNMIDPEDSDDAFRMTFPNGGARTTKGYKFNTSGVDDYGETFFDWERLETAPYLGVAVYMQTTTTTAMISAGSSYAVWLYDADAKSYLYLQGNSPGVTVPYGNKKGFWSAQRTRDDKVQMFHSGEYLLGQTFAIGTSTSSGQTIKLNYNYTSPNAFINEVSLFIIYKTLTQKEQALLYAACEQLMIDMGRYVKP